MSDRDLAVTRVERATSSSVDLAAAPLASHEPLLRRVHRTLRGRYVWAILLALVGAAGGGYAGWKSQQPLYQAEGIIWVAASMPSPQDPAGMNVLPMFKGYMAYQVQLLLSPGLTNEAMMEEAWQATGEGIDPETIRSFVERRSIRHASDTLHIVVSFTDPDPAVALAGVRAILAAYEARTAADSAKNDQLRYATDQTELLAAQLKQNADNHVRLIRDYGSAELLEMQHRAIWEKQRQAEEIHAGLLEILDAPDPATNIAEPLEEMTAEQIALESADMAKATRELALLEGREAARSQVLREKHDELVDLRREIGILREWIQEFTENWNRKRAAVAPVETRNLDEVHRREGLVRQTIEVLKGEWTRLGNLLAEIRGLEASKEDLQRQHDRMKALKEELAARLEVKGRISVSDRGQLPVYPARDRRLAFAAMGALFGGFLGAAIIALIALRDRRFRDSSHVGTSLSRLQLLGLLPHVPDDLSDPESAELAAHSVHQVRTLLQIRRPTDRGAHFCVTGPGVGSGKTTLSLALALSYARSGSRTLLIDADLTGRGLTRRAGQLLYARVCHDLDSVLGGADAGTHVDDSPVIEPLVTHTGSNARPTLERLAEALGQTIEAPNLDAGKARELVTQLFALDDLMFEGRGRDAMVARLCTSAKHGRGKSSRVEEASIPAPTKELTAAEPELNGSPLASYLYPTGVPGLSFLPLRGLKRGHLVSAKALRELLDRAANEFDVVLLDTGPVVGSVETPLVAAAVDGTVLVVCPTDERPQAERALERLDAVGADVRGLVFNRAAIRDVLKSSHSRSSVQSDEDAT